MKGFYFSEHQTNRALEQSPSFFFWSIENEAIRSKNPLNYTYYILDAQGNQMSTYERKVDQILMSVTFELTERTIYGSDRIGTLNKRVSMLGSQNTNYSMINVVNVVGNKNYELKSHQNNVLSVVSDVKIPVDENSDGSVDHYLASIVSSSDYSPFGVLLDGRHFSNGDRYAYSFQGQLHDDELKGEGNSVNYKYRMHDPRLGRFFAVDPLAGQYPHNSPYAFSENIVINAVELEGLEKVYTYVYQPSTNTFKYTYTKVDKNLKENVNRYVYYGSDGNISKTVVRSMDGKREANWSGGYDAGLAMLQFKSIRNESIETSATIAKTKDVTRHLSGEGSHDGGNTGGEYSGVNGMYVAADDLDWLGDKLSYIPTPPTRLLGAIFSAEADALRTIADYNSLDAGSATTNLGIRLVTFGVDKKIGSDIKKASFDKPKEYMSEQLSRKALDELKEKSTTKP
jgi:RHS repeat-associated protein